MELPYSQRLLDGLEEVDFTVSPRTTKTDWKIEGALITFEVEEGEHK